MQLLRIARFLMIGENGDLLKVYKLALGLHYLFISSSDGEEIYLLAAEAKTLAL